MLEAPEQAHALDAFKLARLRERAASDKISQALVDSFMTPIEREDIEALGFGAVQDPQADREVRRSLFAGHEHLAGIDFAPRAAMLEQAAAWWWRWWRTCAT
jgi:hypothetical protein